MTSRRNDIDITTFVDHEGMTNLKISAFIVVLKTIKNGVKGSPDFHLRNFKSNQLLIFAREDCWMEKFLRPPKKDAQRTHKNSC